LGHPVRCPLTADRRFGIALNDPRTVRVSAVNYDLHLGIAVAHLPREIRADADDAINPARENKFLRLGHRGH
jgi:hypothetical protein